MKRLGICVLALLMVLSFAACGGGKTDGRTDGGGAAAEGGVTVAVLAPHLDNPFMNRLTDSVKKYLKDAGYDVIPYVANNDPETQAGQIRAAISEKVSAMILNPCSSEALADAVAEAKAAGIAIVTIHGSISTQEDCVSFTGPDFTNGGKQAMAQAMKDLPEGGNIAILKGAKEESAQLAISAGYPEALAGQESKYPVVAEGYGNWNADDASALVSEWLSSGKEIDAIVCNNDGMATGVLATVTAAGRAGEINIYGLDAQDNILDAIKAGTVKATIYTDFDSEAKQSVEIVKDVLAGKTVEPEYLLPMILITEKNVNEYSK